MDPTSGAGGALAVAVAVVFALLGVALVAAGVLGVRRAVAARRRGAALRERGVRVRGTVVDLQINTRGRGPEARTTYRPVVTFTTSGGAEVTTVAGPDATAAWVERTPVLVRHDPADPEHAEVLQPVPGAAVGTSTTGPLAVGLLLAVVGLVVGATALAGLVT